MSGISAPDDPLLALALTAKIGSSGSPIPNRLRRPPRKLIRPVSAFWMIWVAVIDQLGVRGQPFALTTEQPE